MKDRFNVTFQNIIRPAILLGFSFFVFFKVISKEIMLYIHPRFIPLTIFTGCVLFILALVELKKSFSYKGGRPDILKTATAAVFIAPLLLSILFPPTSMDSAMARKKGGLSTTRQQIAKNRESSKQTSTAGKQKPEEELLQITDENFISRIDDINNEPDEMKGRIVRLIGFVYKQDDFKKDEFALVRFTVSCCTADAVAAGLLFKYPEAATLKQDDWYEVTGRVPSKRKEEWDEMPVLSMLSIKPVEAPKDPYVYPDWYQPSGNKR